MNNETKLDKALLLSMIKERRSRRFINGLSLPEGALEYKSKNSPLTLTEEEEALLIFASCGLTGSTLGDWAWGQGGNMLAGLIGRTVASADAISNVLMFVINDQSTSFVKRPQEMSTEDVFEVLKNNSENKFIDSMKKTRVEISNRRLNPPLEPPFNIRPNMWSLHKKGATYFLPVADLTFFLINVLLELFSEEEGFFALDERNLFLPAGIGQFAKSKGGHLYDRTNDGKVFTIESVERLVAEMAAVEMGSMTQNLGLVCEAMGLGGFPHFSSHDAMWFKTLGFKMEQMRLSKYHQVKFPASLVLKLTKQDIPIEYPLALSSDGKQLLKAYCPPNYKNMEEAVLAVVDSKFGKNGMYRESKNRTAWKEEEKVLPRIQKHSDKAIHATIAYCDYLFKKYGRFPVYYPPYHTLVGFQVGHLDLDFYAANYKPEAISERHLQHMQNWHK